MRPTSSADEKSPSQNEVVIWCQRPPEDSEWLCLTQTYYFNKFNAVKEHFPSLRFLFSVNANKRKPR